MATRINLGTFAEDEPLANERDRRCGRRGIEGKKKHIERLDW